MNNYNDEYDLTKSMLNKIRENFLIKENDENDEDVIDLGDDELKSEQDKFSDMITPRVVFGKFKIYKNANNVVFGGKLDEGVEFQMSLNDGIYINIDNVELTDEIVDILKKLNGYYIEWAKEWSNKLRNEYNNNNDGDEI